MSGAIAGELIGSRYEDHPVKGGAPCGGVPEAIRNRALGCGTCELGAVAVRFCERYRLPHGWAAAASAHRRRRAPTPVAASGVWS